MNNFTCQQFRPLIDALEFGDQGAPADAALLDHLEQCSSCQLLVQRTKFLRERLASAAIAPPPSGFERRVRENIAALRQTPSAQRRWAPYAMAASLVLCVALFFGLSRDLERPDAVQTAAALPSAHTRIQPVKLVVNSQRALSGVSMTVVLPEGVALASRPGVRELSWQTNLNVGANVLELPVISSGMGGVVVATLRYGNAQRQYSLPIDPPDKSGMFLPAAAAKYVAKTANPRSRHTVQKEIRHA